MAMTPVKGGRREEGVQLVRVAAGQAEDSISSMHCLIQKCGPIASQFWLQTTYSSRSCRRFFIEL